MTKEILITFEDLKQKELKRHHFTNNLLSQLTSDNVAETVMELECLAYAVIKGAKHEEYDLKEWFKKCFETTCSEPNIVVYKEFMADYLNEIADEDFPLEPLVAMFAAALKVEVSRDAEK